MHAQAAAISLFTAVAAFFAAVGALAANIGLYRLDKKFDRMTEGIDTPENAHNAHVNAPGTSPGLHPTR